MIYMTILCAYFGAMGNRYQEHPLTYRDAVQFSRELQAPLESTQFKIRFCRSVEAK